MIIFTINRYLKLKFKDKKTFIYVGNKEILVCKKIGIKITPTKIIDYLKYETIDDLEGINYIVGEDTKISSETEFFVHCSNLQIWENNDYNVDLIHSSIAFPILKELVEVGDLRAKRIFKEEIVRRFLNGNRNVQKYLILEGYIQYLSPLERKVIFREEYSKFKSLELYLGYRIMIIADLNLHFGVIIQDKNITGLRLYGENNKLFPYQIKYFKNLTKLYLEDFLTLTIPKWIQNFNNLKKLKLSQNHLIAVPKNIGKLKKLECLNLTLNLLGKLPIEIGSLTELKELTLSYNRFKAFPKEIIGLSQLEDLDLSHNQITVIPPEIGLMHSLRELGLSFNPISSLPDELLDLANIEKIFIGNSNIVIDEEFKKELKKRRVKIFPSGLLEFEASYTPKDIQN